MLRGGDWGEIKGGGEGGNEGFTSTQFHSQRSRWDAGGEGGDEGRGSKLGVLDDEGGRGEVLDESEGERGGIALISMSKT